MKNGKYTGFIQNGISIEEGLKRWNECIKKEPPI
jgi:hypothetical protein